MRDDPAYERRTDRWLIRLMNRRNTTARLAILALALILVGATLFLIVHG